MQDFIVGLLVVIAAGYVLRQTMRTFAGKKSCGSCGSCPGSKIPEPAADPKRISLL